MAHGDHRFASHFQFDIAIAQHHEAGAAQLPAHAVGAALTETGRGSFLSFDPPGGDPHESWRSLFYANLIRDFVDEILDGGPRNQGNFRDGAAVQEVINAVERSHHEQRWVQLPLER